MNQPFLLALTCGFTCVGSAQEISKNGLPVSLDRVLDFRDQCLNLSVSATIRVVGMDISDITGATHSDAVQGWGEWRQDGVSKYYSVRYDLPIEQKSVSASGYFLDQDFYLLPDRRVIHFVMTRQIVVTDDRAIPYFPCLDSVLFGCLPTDTADSLAAAARVLEKGTEAGILLTISSTVDESETLTVTLDPVLDYAPVSWERGVLSCAVDWQRADDGLVIPKSATLVSSMGPTWFFEFDVFDVGGCETIRFSDIPGTLVGDYVENPGEQAVYTVGDNGEREPVVLINTTPRPVPPATQAAVVAGSIFTVIISAGASILWHARRARRKVTAK